MFLRLVTFNLLTPTINASPGPMVEHFYVTFGDPSCIGFWDIVRKNRQTHKLLWKPYHTTAVGMGKNTKLETVCIMKSLQNGHHSQTRQMLNFLSSHNSLPIFGKSSMIAMLCSSLPNFILLCKTAKEHDYPCESKRMCFHRRSFVCVSVTTIILKKCGRICIKFFCEGS